MVGRTSCEPIPGNPGMIEGCGDSFRRVSSPTQPSPGQLSLPRRNWSVRKTDRIPDSQGALVPDANAYRLKAGAFSYPRNVPTGNVRSGKASTVTVPSAITSSFVWY